MHSLYPGFGGGLYALGKLIKAAWERDNRMRDLYDKRAMLLIEGRLRRITDRIEADTRKEEHKEVSKLLSDHELATTILGYTGADRYPACLALGKAETAARASAAQAGNSK